MDVGNKKCIANKKTTHFMKLLNLLASTGAAMSTCSLACNDQWVAILTPFYTNGEKVCVYESWGPSNYACYNGASCQDPLNKPPAPGWAMVGNCDLAGCSTRICPANVVVESGKGSYVIDTPPLCGQEVEFTAVADEGFAVVDVLVNGISIGPSLPSLLCRIRPFGYSSNKVYVL